MLNYIIRRVFLIIPTLIGIMILNFFIIQLAPGGPVEQILARYRGTEVRATERVSGTGGAGEQSSVSSKEQQQSGSDRYRGSQGLDEELRADLERLYGFDKPLYVRFLVMMRNYFTFNFGESFFRDRTVIQLIVDKLPVSISLGVWTTLIIYLVSIPLGIRKAVKVDTPFDVWTSTVVTIGYAIPGFLFAVLLVVLFAGGSFLRIFPLRGLVSDDWASFTWYHKIGDYLWHIVLPVTANVIGGFATLTIFTKNSFLEEINKQYVTTARAKGLTERKILRGHVFRNAMLLIIAGFPSAFIGVLFTSSLLIEVIFSLDGLGLLGYESLINRDYPVVFGTMFIGSLLGLLLNLGSDIMYTIIDPRIDFETREV
jgi:microcin C transport system permease protein